MNPADNTPKESWWSFWEKESLPSGFLIVVTLLHLGLGMVMHQSKIVATIHALMMVVIGLWVLLRGKSLVGLAYVGGYLVAGEVLWRMCQARTNWEFVKIFITFLFVAGIIKSGRWKIPVPAGVYLACLLPAVFMTLSLHSLGEALALLSTDFSGPVTLVVAVWFFSKVGLTRDQFNKLAWCVVWPTAALQGALIYSIRTATNLNFNSASNFDTSGGFGPNQVSASLGLGFILGFYALMQKENRALAKVFLLLLLLGFLGQGALTFSRTGFYLSVGGVLTAAFFLCTNAEMRFKAVLGIGVAAALGWLVVWPVLNNFTQGALLRRFQSLESTNRDDLAKADFKIWMEHPMYGVGLGRGLYFREFYQDNYNRGHTAAHTEYSRLVAEHGIFGLVAMLMLFVMAGKNVLRAKSAFWRALAAGLLVWAFLFMLVSGMRLTAPGFLIGLSGVTLLARYRRPVVEVEPLGTNPGWRPGTNGFAFNKPRFSN